jgi:hypothetical protein
MSASGKSRVADYPAQPETIQQGESAAPNVTSVRLRNRWRKRLQRERQRAILYDRDDWQLFLDAATLPQKAGCEPEELPALVLKELADNALDAGANVSLTTDGKHWIVQDDGPGVDPDQVPHLFEVNRPLRSSKLKRQPTRGMLGNGLRVVMAWARQLIVETRGVRLSLKLDEITGHTLTIEREKIQHAPGLTVRLQASNADDAGLARRIIRLARFGFIYDGPSLPQWYGQQDLARLFRAAPADATVEEVIRDLGLSPTERSGSQMAHEIGSDEVGTLLREMQQQTKAIQPEKIGRLGALYLKCQGYAHKAGIVIEQAGGHVPYVVEANVRCERSKTKGSGQVEYRLTVNRSATLAHLHGYSEPDYLSILGCGLDVAVGAPTGNYSINLSVITPHIQLTSDGKSPSLKAYEGAIVDVIFKAARQAHRAMVQPEKAMSIKAAAWQVMPAAYLTASTNGALPANARQVMYAARGPILRLTGKGILDDHYFTQTLLPDYMEEHLKTTVEWDVVFDDRGSLTEPHTGRVVPLGTIQVRQYLQERPQPEVPATIDPGSMSETVGPLNRYRDILFIEKEGFSALIAHAQIAERFDIGIMSTKGMSVTAARLLIDKLMQFGLQRVFVLHDFDLYGFSIFGTLGKSSRRYRFHSEARIVDLGLRLEDIEAMGLEAEPYTPGAWEKRAAKLAEHGASSREIKFLRTHRVELNAMASDVFVRFIERKLAEHGVRKIVPDDGVLEQHARRIISRKLLNKHLGAIRPKAEVDATLIDLPDDLRRQVEAALELEPSLPWDLAVADIARRTADTEGTP